jgi:hypothetical protein
VSARSWAGDPSVDIFVVVSSAGPFDPPFTQPSFELTNYAGRNYVLGEAGIKIERGRPDEFQPFQQGQLTLTLRNDNREFDPTNSSSPFAAILKPLRRIQVYVTYAGGLYSLFVGYVDGWPRTWSKTNGTVEITAKDALSIMARAETAPSHGVMTFDDPMHGLFDHGRFAGDLPQQLTGERVITLLQLAGFSDGTETVVDPGNTMVVASQADGNILGQIQDAERAEAGFFFIDSSGVIRFYDRYSRFLKPRTGTVQRVLTDREYSGLQVDFDLESTWNDVGFTRPDGLDPQRFVDEMSLHDFGIRTFSDELPVVSDGELLARAQFWTLRYGQPKDRPSPVQIKPRKNMASLFPFVARVELLDRVQLQRTPLGVGPMTTFTGLVEHVAHDIDRESWVTTLTTSPIDVDDGAGFLIFDDAVNGKFDTAEFAY